MPALRLFGRRWLLADDDVPLPAAVCCLFHFVWCILLIIWYVSVHGPRECSGAWQYDVAVGGLLASFAVSVVLEALMVRHGLRGGPFERSPRRLLPRLIYLDMASHVCQVAFNGYGTNLVYSAVPPQCESGRLWDPVETMQVLVWCTWGLIAAILVLLVLSYNLFPDYTDPRSWERRCNCIGTMLFCCGRQDSEYRDESGKRQRLTSRLGNIFATLFSHIDMTPTDILLAFSLAMMLQRIQRKQRQQQQAEAGGAGGAAGGASRPSSAAAEVAARHQTLGAASAAAAASGGPAAFAAYGSAGAEVELSPQNSPHRGSPSPDRGSMSSSDGLLGMLGLRSSNANSLSDLEAGLLPGRKSRGHANGSGKHGANGDATASSAAGGTDGTGAAARAAHPELHGESFLPVRPVELHGVELQVGAQKTEEGPEGQPLPGDSKAGEAGAVDADTLTAAAWAMKYAFASYGVLLFIFSKPTTGCVELCCGRQCGLLVGTARGRRVRRKLDLRLVHNLNREATQQAAGLRDHDLLDVRYEGEVPHVLPYFLAVDETKRCVVLAIRGSLSLDDVVRDLLFEPASLDEWVGAEGPAKRWDHPPPDLLPATSTTKYAAHAGILEAARATFLDIQEHGVLYNVLLAPDARCAGYQLVVTGHSLGAGCAFLLALYLRHFCPGLSCWAFSAPGGLASRKLCAESSDWCTSVVCGKEWIPRLSVSTFENMRDEMVWAALRCKRPKWLVLLGLMLGKKWTEEELFYHRHQLPAEVAEALQGYNDSKQRTANLCGYMQLANDFTPPGRCIYLKPTGVEAQGCRWAVRHTKQRQYRAVYIDPSSIIAEGILISGRMMADHMPDYALAVLRRMARSMRHLLSTATVSDAAGEQLADDIMQHHDWDADATSSHHSSRASGRGAGASSAGGGEGSSMASSEAPSQRGAGGSGANRPAAGPSSAQPSAAVAPPAQQPALRRASSRHDVL